MADQKQKLNLPIPQQSHIYLGICLIGLLLFVFGGIVPAYWTLSEMDERAAGVKQRIEEQKILVPIHKTLQSAGEQKDSTTLTLPEKGKLAQANIDTLPANLNAVVRTSGMSLVSAIPNVGALTGDAKSIPVNIVLKGNFQNFRKLLISLGGLPYVDHIEEIMIQGKTDAKEYRLKVWVAIG
jgi:hypothetical protein